MGKIRPQAPCHPDRKHYARGLCHQCYDAEKHKRYYADDSKRQHRINRVKAYYQANKERIHWRDMRTKFGITQQQYEQLQKKQGNLCAVCLGPPKDLRRGAYFCIDHDRTCCKGIKSCGRCVRGLLCITCNAGLGQFSDRSELLEKAIAYLRSFPLKQSQESG